MQALWQTLTDRLADFSLVESVLIAANLLLLVFSRPLLSLLSSKSASAESFQGKLHIFRAANILVLLLVLGSLILPIASHSWITRLLAAVLLAFLGYLCAHVANYFIKRRFGRQREVNGQQVWSETYKVRLISLLTSVLLFVVVLIAEVRILGFDSLLEAGGVIGFFGVVLALTQGAWAPDIISGLVILNSRLVEEGDVIELDDATVATVFKTKIFHTELLNLANNHRTMIGNAALRAMTIHNLSKFASAKGLREAIVLKVGYDTDRDTMQAYVDATFAALAEDKDCAIEANSETELRTTDAGDFAVEWTVFYYTKDIRRVLHTRQQVLGALIARAGEHGVSLATPVLYSQVSGSPAAALPTPTTNTPVRADASSPA